MIKLLRTLKQAGQPTQLYRSSDGTRVLVLPHGGRVLGLYTPQTGENFYWTHPEIESIKTARAFYAGDQWQNSGGDRTWLAPEVDLFFPNFPKLDKYYQQRSLDPGHYQLVTTATGFKLVNRLTVNFSRLQKNIALKITKSFGPALNPLRHERGLDLRGIEYAGYTQFTSLELAGPSTTTRAQVGLWNLVQMPHGGEMLIPTYSRTDPFRVFGDIPAADLAVEDRAIRYRMRQQGEHKISLRTVAVCGRVGYRHQTGNQQALIIRNFAVNPSGEYVDVPWTDTGYFGFAVQACNVNSGLGTFSELEYHIPAIGYRTGRTRCDDDAQVWAFRGPKEQIVKIGKRLLG